MKLPTTATGKFVVRCDDFTTKPYRTREAAEARLADIEKHGHCREPHEVVEQ